MESKGCVEIVPEKPAVACVIWLHGLGANGHDFEAVVPYLKIRQDLPIWYIFPHAPSIPVTINNNFVMPAWYDILGLDRDSEVDEDGIRKSTQRITNLIEAVETEGVSTSKVIIAGFSQGGAVAIETALTFPRKLGGLISLSSYFPTRNTIQTTEENKNLPILICHGLHDAVVAETMGKQTHEALVSMGYPSEYRTYDAEHSVVLEELEDIGQWIENRFKY